MINALAIDTEEWFHYEWLKGKRGFPLSFIYRGLKRIYREQAFLLHFHPWGGFSETPKLKAPIFNRFVYYHGIQKAFNKFECLLLNKFTRID